MTPAEPIEEEENPITTFWGEIDYANMFESFSPFKLETGSVANVNILALINGDSDREQDVFGTGGYPQQNKFNNSILFNNWIDQILGNPQADPPVLGILNKSQTAVSASDGNVLEDFLGYMVFYMENGITLPGSEETIYFTPELVRQLDLIVKSLHGAGWRRDEAVPLLPD